MLNRDLDHVHPLVMPYNNSRECIRLMKSLLKSQGAASTQLLDEGLEVLTGLSEAMPQRTISAVRQVSTSSTAHSRQKPTEDLAVEYKRSRHSHRQI